MSRILKCISTYMQNTLKFYSIVYATNDDTKSYPLKDLKIVNSTKKRYMKIMYGLTIIAYSVIILFFLHGKILIKMTNYFFGFVSLKNFIGKILSILLSKRSGKEKFKEIFLIIKKIMVNIVIISIFNIISVCILEVVQLREKLDSLESNLMEICQKENKKVKTVKSNIRRKFYFYLGIRLRILISLRFGFGFSISGGSENNSVDFVKDNQKTESVLNGKQVKGYTEESTFSSVMTFIGY